MNPIQFQASYIRNKETGHFETIFTEKQPKEKKPQKESDFYYMAKAELKRLRKRLKVVPNRQDLYLKVYELKEKYDFPHRSTNPSPPPYTEAKPEESGIPIGDSTL